MIKSLINKFTCNESQLPIILKTLEKQKFRPIFDYINENKADHYNNFKTISKNIDKFPNNYFAIKLSSLNIENDYNLTLKYTHDLVNQAINNKSKLLIDAENYTIQENINDISNIMMKDYNINEVNVFKTYQAYRKDCFSVLEKDFKDKQINDYNLGIKLVRGAYYNEDYKYKILFNSISETHRSYDKCALYFMNKCNDNDKLLVASHNKESIEIIKKINLKYCLENIEFAQLMGMSDNLSKSLAYDYNTYKYIPYGDLKESLPYLLRRLNENKSMLFNI